MSDNNDPIIDSHSSFEQFLGFVNYCEAICSVARKLATIKKIGQDRDPDEISIIVENAIDVEDSRDRYNHIGCQFWGPTADYNTGVDVSRDLIAAELNGDDWVTPMKERMEVEERERLNRQLQDERDREKEKIRRERIEYERLKAKFE